METTSAAGGTEPNRATAPGGAAGPGTAARPGDGTGASEVGGGVVLACGLATLDVVQTVARVPAADEKVVATDLLVAAGGPAANAAVTAALLGVPARLVTRIGGGVLGAAVAGDLRVHGVEVVDAAPDGASPPVSTVLVTAATGERAVVSVNARGSGGEGGVGPGGGAGGEVGVGPGGGVGGEGGVGPGGGVASEDGLWAGAGVLLVDGHHLDLAEYFARAARRRGVPVLLDGGSWKPGLERLLALVDIAVLSADFAVPDGVGAAGDDTAGGSPAGGGAPGGDVLRAVRALGPGVVAQSHGPGPIRLLAGAEVVDVEVPGAAVVDTLGAGDVLHGALAAWLATRGTGDVRSAVAWAGRLASASCAARGARGWAADPTHVAAWRAGLLGT